MISATLAAAGISAAASMIGSALKRKTAEKEADREDALINKQEAENKAFYDRYYNMDATQLADNRFLLTQAENRFNRANRAASGTQAVMGGSNASAAAAKEANNQALGQVYGTVAANAQQYKNNLMNSYRERANALQNARLKLVENRSAAKQAAIDGAVQGVGQAAASWIASNTDSANAAPTAPTEPTAPTAESTDPIKK